MNIKSGIRTKNWKILDRWKIKKSCEARRIGQNYKRRKKQVWARIGAPRKINLPLFNTNTKISSKIQELWDQSFLNKPAKIIVNLFTLINHDVKSDETWTSSRIFVLKIEKF